MLFGILLIHAQRYFLVQATLWHKTCTAGVLDFHERHPPFPISDVFTQSHRLFSGLTCDVWRLLLVYNITSWLFGDSIIVPFLERIAV